MANQLGFLRNNVVYALVFATLVALMPAMGFFQEASHQANDSVYQKVSTTNPDVVIIGIDSHTIDHYGSFPFDRQVFAQVITLLSQSDTPPLAIGVDVLFTGETNPESDQALVEAVSQAGNVVLATSGNYGRELVMGESQEAYLSPSQVLSMNHPFPSLLAVGELGHINSALDEDGILRHCVLSIQTPEGQGIPSLHLALYQKYCQFHGLPLGELPGNQWYLPFSGKPGGYDDGYSVLRVLNGEIPTSVFQDKLVLVGPYAIGLQDHYLTAIDHTNLMYGVEYQANALAALIQQDFVTAIPPICHQLILFTLVFAVFYGTHGRKLWLCGCACLGVTGGYLWGCGQLFRLGWLLPVFYLPVALALLFVTEILCHGVVSNLEKRQVTATFKRYVAPEVVEQILKTGTEHLAPGGKTTQLAVMFLDVRKFTPLSERFSAQEVVSILNQLLDVMASTIMKNGGTLDKFIGDAVLCFWGAPIPRDDYIHCAVATAVEIQENLAPVLEKINQALEEKIHLEHQEMLEKCRAEGKEAPQMEPIPQVAVGIGIASGSAVVGNIGSKDRLDFTVIGDTVNTAQRIESQAQGGTIYVSEAVMKAVAERYTFQEIAGGLKLKGKEKNVATYILQGTIAPERGESL